MTKAEYYDLLVKSAYNGTFPSIRGKQCYYRADLIATGQRRCAVGLLIPDSEYDMEMEHTLEKILKQSWIPQGITPDDLRQVQFIHDCIAKALHEGWDAEEFVDGINALECFKDIA